LIGFGVAYGAASIINAVASGKGATFGLDLATKAKVTLAKGQGWETVVNGRPASSQLAGETAKRALEMLDKKGDWGGRLETWSEMPIGVGLKSSSSASLAVCLAVHSALGMHEFDAQNVLKCSAEASLTAGVSLTGAFDDAASCLLGGINHTDNGKMRLLKHGKFSKSLRVLARIPSETSRRELLGGFPVSKLSGVTSRLFDLSLAGDHWASMVLNGLLFSALLRYDSVPALRAIELGALGAGLSGTGPATVAVFDPAEADRVEELKEEWASDGAFVIDTKTSNKRGRIGRSE
jgi:shikimate kinase